MNIYLLQVVKPAQGTHVRWLTRSDHVDLVKYARVFATLEDARLSASELKGRRGWSLRPVKFTKEV